MSASVLLTLLTFWLTSGTGVGAGNGGGYLLRGPDALFVNPALLAYRPTTSIRLLSLGVEVGNNAFSVNDYNRIVGDTLDDAEKDALLARIPAGGWAFTSRILLGGLEGSVGPFGFSLKGLTSFRVALPRGALQLLLYGNPIGSRYEFVTDPQYLLSVGSLSLAYARALHLRQLPQPLYLGIGIRLLKGILSWESSLTQAYLITRETGIDTEWEGQTAFSGILARALGDAAKSGDALPLLGSFGFGFDLGALYEAHEDWTVGVALINLNTGLTFAMEEQWGRFALEGFRLILLEDTLSPDTATEVRYPVSYRFPVPGRFTAGVLYRGLEPYGLLLSGTLLQEFGLPFERPPLYLGFGAEFHRLSFLPLRLHLGLGGRNRFELGAGFGLRLGPVALFSLGGEFLGGVGNGARGLRIGFDLLSIAP